MARIIELRTAPERLRADQAAVLRDALLPHEAALPEAVRSLIGHLDRQTAARNRWSFVMLSPDQNAAVVDYLAAHSSRPVVAMRTWALCFRHLRIDTGEVMLTRDGIAEALGQPAREISRVMGELEDCGAVIRRIEKVAGMKGRGRVHYFFNPRVATHLTGQERDAAQAASKPILSIVRGDNG